MDFSLDFSDDKPDRKRLRHGIEVKKTSQGVFDDATMMSLYSLAKKKRFERLVGIVSQGKEANVYHATSADGDVAVKVYCVDACDFKRMREHIAGDPRFSVGKNRRRLVHSWAHREFRNLQVIHGKVSCPKPIAVFNNILVMEFIGEDGVPAAKIKDAGLGDAKQYYEKVLGQITAMHSCGIVHGDLSEYNILDYGGPVLIDFSMGVTLNHPFAGKLLERDVGNIVKFFGKHGIEDSAERVLSELNRETQV
ncbi:MAG: serine protein kinase RIO [Candidatus Altiarchaeota archaeon]